jgi:hypothetical protein
MCPYAAEETWIDADAAMTPPPDLEERGHAPEGSYEGALAALDATVPTAPAGLVAQYALDATLEADKATVLALVDEDDHAADAAYEAALAELGISQSKRTLPEVRALAPLHAATAP